MAIKMTRAEYEAKYGTKVPTSTAPIKMTRAEYEAKYGQPQQPTQPERPTRDWGKDMEALGNIIGGTQLGRGLGTMLGRLTPEVQSLEKDIMSGKISPEGSKFYAKSLEESTPTSKQVLGDVAQIGLSLASVGKLAGKVPQAISGVQKVISPLQKTSLGRIGTAVGTGTIFGGLQGASTALKEQKAVVPSAIGGATTGALIGGTLQGGLEGINFLAEKAKILGQKIQQTSLKPSLKDIKSGFKIENVEKYNLGGSTEDTLDKATLALQERGRKLREVLTSKDNPIDVMEAVSETKKRLAGEKLGKFGTNVEEKKAVQNLIDEINETFGKKTKIDLGDANQLKQATGLQGAWQYGKPDKSAKAEEQVYNTFYEVLKELIEKNANDPLVKSLNKEMSEIIPIQHSAVKRLPVEMRNQPLGLKESASILTSIGSGNAAPMGWLLVEHALKSGKVGSFLAKTKPLQQKVNSELIKIGSIIKR